MLDEERAQLAHLLRLQLRIEQVPLFRSENWPFGPSAQRPAVFAGAERRRLSDLRWCNCGPLNGE
eukprot:5853158-Alexandrium_andersonii.AAC.1